MSRSAGQAFKEIQRCGQIVPDPGFLEGQRVLKKALKHLPENHTMADRIDKIQEVMQYETKEGD